MLVFVSDLHFTDGSNGVGLDPGAFDLFAPRLAELAMRASYRADGRYRPVDRIDLVLLGDVLDFTRSRRWLAGPVRPWSDPATAPLLDTALVIADDIINANDAVLRNLQAIGAEGAIRLPQASAAGVPLANYDSQPVPVSIHYMVGNCDWLLHTSTPGFERLRKRVCHALGLASDYRSPFPHEASESEELLQVLRAHGVVARHGDCFDPLSCGDDRDMSSINEAVAIELIQQFLVAVESEMSSDIPPEVLAQLRELDHFRPVALAAVYLEGLWQRTGLRAPIVKQLKRTWDRLAEAVLHSSLVRGGGLSVLDITTPLADALLFSRKVSLGWTASIQAWLRGLRGATSESFAPHALQEPDYRNRRARHVVYGHTHRSELLPLDASFADGYVLHQTYFNTGTWRRKYEQTQSVAGQHEFLATDSFSFLTFFQGDERGGRPYEVWNGTLGTTAEFQLPVAPLASKRHTNSVRQPHFASAGAVVRK